VLHIEVETVWRFRKSDSPQPAVVMLGVLDEIRKTGKLTSAADHAQLSYRHVWNLIEQWSAFFGVPLVETRRGKGTTLTPFGEKLVWAGQRMQARLGPQLENLAQELVTEIKAFLHQRPSVIRVHPPATASPCRSCGSFLDRTPGIGVDLRYVSNQKLAGLAGAGRLRPVRRASAARRIAPAERRGVPRMLDPARVPRHQFCHARDGADGQAR